MRCGLNCQVQIANKKIFNSTALLYTFSLKVTFSISEFWKSFCLHKKCDTQDNVQ